MSPNYFQNFTLIQLVGIRLIWLVGCKFANDRLKLVDKSWQLGFDLALTWMYQMFSHLDTANLVCRQECRNKTLFYQYPQINFATNFTQFYQT